MPDLLVTSLSGLLTSQRALSVTGHNVANANTPGYSRQRLDVGARLPDGFGRTAIGRGVQAIGVSRSYDQFLGQELRLAESAFSRSESFHGLSSRIDGLLADPAAGISPAMSGFFAAVNDVANDPSSIPAREALLGQARSLSDRFEVVDGRMRQLEQEVGARVSQSVDRINSLAEGIAAVNNDIVTATAAGGGQAPGDLLDKRDMMLGELAGIVGVATVPQDDGALNIFIGSGQGLVVGAQAAKLATAGNKFDPTSAEIVFASGGSQTPITSALSGGSLGGALDFRREVLQPARNELGRLATAMASGVNDRLGEGMDLYGDLGSPLFKVSAPDVLPSSANTSSATVAAQVADAGALTGEDYLLRFDGASYSLALADGGASVPLSGTGTPGDPLVADGLELVVGAGMAAGDTFLVRPTARASQSLDVAISDPRRIAAAAPVRAQAANGNAGTGAISQGVVVDSSDPALMTGATISFTAPGTYEINGSGPFPYVEGEPIVVGGASFSITGVPAAGDSFAIEANTGGVGDNRNALNLASLDTDGLLDGGTLSISAGFGALVASVGTVTGQAATSLDAQSVLRNQAQQQVLSVSGVNLDEEAANMLRYQQTYEASARMVSIADNLFQTLLAAVR